MFDCLGIDWGEKRFGLAKGDSQTKLVLPFSTDFENVNIWDFLDNLILDSKNDFKLTVIGRPVNFFLKPTKTTNEVDKFSKIFYKKYPTLKTIFINERSTTIQAKNLVKNISKTDLNHLAAAQILENYFNLQ